MRISTQLSRLPEAPFPFLCRAGSGQHQQAASPWLTAISLMGKPHVQETEELSDPEWPEHTVFPKSHLTILCHLLES